MPKANKIMAMIKREIKISLRNKGRFVGEVIVPLISILIWGMLSASNVVRNDVASMLISIQILWTLVYTFQSYVNVSMMYDIWSREIGVIMPEVSLTEYLISKVVASFIVVSLISATILIILHGFFGFSLQNMIMLAISLPAVFIFALSVSFAVLGIILSFGRTYDFLSWSVMNFIILFSFPFSIPQGLSWLKPFASIIPMYHAFALARGNGSLVMLYILSLLWAIVGYAILSILYRNSLRNGMLAEMSST